MLGKAGTRDTDTTDSKNFVDDITKPINCAACDAPIVDRYLLQAMDRQWHTECLKCSTCHSNLMADPDAAESKCYVRDGRILCRTDYINYVAAETKCQGCLMTIAPTEPVLRVPGIAAHSASSSNAEQLTPSVYHVTCLLCRECHAPLKAGDKFVVFKNQPVCEAHLAAVIAVAPAGEVVKSTPTGTALQRYNARRRVTKRVKRMVKAETINKKPLGEG